MAFLCIFPPQTAPISHETTPECYHNSVDYLISTGAERNCTARPDTFLDLYSAAGSVADRALRPKVQKQEVA